MIPDILPNQLNICIQDLAAALHVCKLCQGGRQINFFTNSLLYGIAEISPVRVT